MPAVSYRNALDHITYRTHRKDTITDVARALDPITGGAQSRAQDQSRIQTRSRTSAGMGKTEHQTETQEYPRVRDTKAETFGTNWNLEPPWGQRNVFPFRAGSLEIGV
jgi:hypothetical protein